MSEGQFVIFIVIVFSVITYFAEFVNYVINKRAAENEEPVEVKHIRREQEIDVFTISFEATEGQ